MTFHPDFKVTTFFEVEYLKNGSFYGQSYYRTLIGNHTQLKKTAQRRHKHRALEMEPKFFALPETLASQGRRTAKI